MPKSFNLRASVAIRSATVADVPHMVELERRCPTAAHWTDQQYRQILLANGELPERLVVVAEGSPQPLARKTPNGPHRLLGFLVARHIASEWELENIVVAPKARRNGIGKRLLDALLDHARLTNSASNTVFLEVRESNSAARALYERLGFRQGGRRTAYYSSPPEDAVVYRLNLK